MNAKPKKAEITIEAKAVDTAKLPALPTKTSTPRLPNTAEVYAKYWAAKKIEDGTEVESFDSLVFEHQCLYTKAIADALSREGEPVSDFERFVIANYRPI